jgi:hypothetical protein
MDDTILDHIIRSAQILPPDMQGRFIAERAIKTQRATDAAISDEDLQAELDAWFQREYGYLPGQIVTAWALGWARHLLSGVRHAT